MNQKDACLFALDKAKLFESSDHRTRFKELMDCYSQFPFFYKRSVQMYVSVGVGRTTFLHFTGGTDGLKPRQKHKHGRYA